MLKDIIDKLGFKENSYTLKDGKLLDVLKSGELRKVDYKCVRNLDGFKIFACHFSCALQYTKYIVADLETGKCYECEMPSYLTGNLSDICRFLTTEPSEKKTADFDPLAWLDE